MSDSSLRLNLSAGLASIFVAAVIALMKLWAFLQTGSLSIAASLADSALDFMVSSATLLAILYAARPADDDHAFGHTSVEDLTALAQALFILCSAALIGWQGVQRLFGPEDGALTSEGVGIAVMLASILLTLGLVAWQRRVARQTGSKVVEADSLHYLGDLIPSAGAIGSLIISHWFGIHQIDSIVAIVAALLMMRGALRIGRRAWDALMDRRASPEVIAGIEAIVARWPGVHGFHDLKTRTSGSTVFVNLHIELDGRQSLYEAHEIGAGLRRAILAQYPQADVIIHKDPLGHPEED